MRTFVIGVVALVSTATLAACSTTTPTAGAAPASPPAATSGAPAESPAAPASPAPSRTTATPERTTAKPTRTTAKPARPNAVTSDLSQLTRLGIDLKEGVLIDVADDGQDRYLQISRNGVDFTGTTKTDSTMMSLKAAPVRQKNRVVIEPPFYNEDLGDGYCVADTTGAALKLQTCRAGRAAQIFEVRPAGDSGQFELHGIHGVIRVDNGKITTSGTGRTGLQTIPFA